MRIAAILVLFTLASIGQASVSTYWIGTNTHPAFLVAKSKATNIQVVNHQNIRNIKVAGKTFKTFSELLSKYKEPYGGFFLFFDITKA